MSVDFRATSLLCFFVLFANARFLPEAAKRKARANPAVVEMYSGRWTKRMTTGEPLGDPKDVLIKPVGFLSEREVKLGERWGT